MIRFRDLRVSLQGPRKTADAWYGKWVIRRVSIYVTWFLAQLGLRANHVTLLSLMFALIGIANLAYGNFTIGILGLNFWYLLDHVDGEMARLRNESSLSGTFFDTVINFLIQPFTFLGLCVGLVQETGWQTLFWGLVAASGSLMLLAIPMTEEAVLFNESIKRRVVYQRVAGQNSAGTQKRGLFRRGYRLLHTSVTYPSVLLIMTVGYLMPAILMNDPLHRFVFFYRFLIVYAFAVTAVWVTQLFYKVYFRVLDRSWKSASGTSH